MQQLFSKKQKNSFLRRSKRVAFERVAGILEPKLIAGL
jgi:hypothetical protein